MRRMLQVVPAPAGCRVFHQSSHSMVAGREAEKQEEKDLVCLTADETGVCFCGFPWVTYQLLS